MVSMTEQQLQDLIQKVTVQTLIQYGLHPEPLSGMYLERPSLMATLQMLNGGNSSDAKQAEPITLPLTPGTVFTEPSSLTLRLGKATAELDTLINTLTKIKEELPLFCGIVEDGIHGLDVVDN